MSDFLIIKYYIRARLKALGEGIAYAKVTATKRSHEVDGKATHDYSALIKNISRQDALEIIRARGLKIAHKDENGIIWDSGNFQLKYKGNIYIPRDI